MSKYLNLVSYFGGKFPHLSWLIDQFPKGNYHFIDLMCGSANIALNVDYPLITVNDLNDEIINLFEVLRTDHERFINLIYFTPFSRSELYKIIDSPVSEDPVERAMQYFVRCQLGYGANGSQNNHKGAGFEYKLHTTNYYRVDNWNLKLKKMAAIVEKLKSFQVEGRDALDLIDKLDKPRNLIYIDPPYLMKVRTSGKRYLHEVDEAWHATLAEKVQQLNNALCVISGYDHRMYAELFPEFYKKEGPQSNATVSKRGIKECIWCNYDPDTINHKTLKLFT